MTNETVSDHLTVLDQIRDSLAATLQSVEREEQALAESQLQEQGTGERTVVWHHTLDRMGDRFREWGQQISEALRRAAQVEQLLNETEQQLGQTITDLRRISTAIQQGPGDHVPNTSTQTADL